MKTTFRLSIVLLLCVMACGKNDSLPAPKPNVSKNTGGVAPGTSVPTQMIAPDAPKKEKSPLDFLKTDSSQNFYNPSGKRDPFKPFEGGEVLLSRDTGAPLERFELNQLELTAVVWGIARPKVLFQAPDGYSYIAQVGTGIGRNRGKITKVTKNKVLVSEEFRDPSGQYIARDSEFVIEQDEGSVDKLFQEMEVKYSDE